jgi:hypothetical protein
MAVHICFFACSVKLTLSDDDEVWVYCPSVADELKEELQRSREERLRFEQMKWQSGSPQKGREGQIRP